MLSIFRACKKITIYIGEQSKRFISSLSLVLLAMGSFCNGFITVALLALLASAAHGQLSANFYRTTCPGVETVVRSVMAKAVAKEARMAASILRLFFHDCFVNGCDGSILLDEATGIKSEKNASPNKNSARGFEVIDAIKSKVESTCQATVSCADILALATRDGVNLLGGPSWTVQLGRRDSLTANQNGANNNLPGPSSSLSTLISMFQAQNLTASDMTVLSGAHTIGQGQCQFFRSRVNGGDSNVDARFASIRAQKCPSSGNSNNLASLDVQTPFKFDNWYYQDLLVQRGLFHSDQELFNGGSQDSLVKQYSSNGAKFAADFAKAMIKLGNLSPLTGKKGEIRLNCRKVNS